MHKQPSRVGDDFFPRLLAYFERKKRHILIGEASLELGYSLRVCEYQLERLVSKGAIRHLTDAEKKSFDLHDDIVAYEFINASMFTRD